LFTSIAGHPGWYAKLRAMPVAATMRLAALVLLAASGGRGEHPCEAEVLAACPDRPAAELGACLKNPSEHETETSLSSECTDFVALNSACSEDIEKHCDGSFFSADTILCLKTWTDPESLSAKCTNVMKWAIPAPAEEESSEEGPTDELGMSDQDRQEKEEWRQKRKAARGDAIERMKMKERDAEKERKRVELENFKRDKPEEYKAMIQLEEENKRQAQAQKKRERLAQAALDRQKRMAAEQDEAEAPAAESGKKKKGKKSKAGGSWLSSILSLGGIVLVVCGLFYGAKIFMGGGKSSGRPRGKKRR